MIDIRTVIKNMGNSQRLYLTYEVGVNLTGGKKNKMVGRVTKRVSKSKVTIYRDNVFEQKMLKIDPNYKSKGMLQGVRNDNEPIIFKNGKEFLEMYIDDNNGVCCVEYLLDGKIIDADKIIGLPTIKTSGTSTLTVGYRLLTMENILDTKCI